MGGQLGFNIFIYLFIFVAGTIEATPVDGLEVVQELGRDVVRAPIVQEPAR